MQTPVETLFARFAATGDPDALAAVFDQFAPRLLLVAAHLAGGGFAEDIVQATFVDAIRQRQRWDRTRPLAPWLIGLLGIHVRRARRERRRLPDPARVGTRASESAESLAEANECFEAVAAAVEALPRHYRQVLSLRLVHGLELQQIAHSLDVPLGTVKVRVHRGLVLLRRALPAGFTASVALLAVPSLGLAAARQAVLAEAASATAAVAAVAATGIAFGGFGMKKLALGVAIAAVAAVGWFTFGPDAGTAPVGPPPQQAAALVVAGVEAPQRPDAVRATPEAAPAAPVIAANERAAAPTTGSLVVQAVWASDGAPAPDVTLRAYPMPANAAAGTRVRLQDAAVGTTDAAGRAAFAALQPGKYSLMAVGAPSQSAASRVEVRAGESAGFRLAIEGTVQLRVTVVAADGAPRHGATVWQRIQQASADPFRCLGTTDAAGRLEWRGFPPNEIWARAAGLQPSPLHTLPQTAPTDPIDVRLVLGGPGCTLLGSVADPQGRPAAGARVLIACDDSLLPAEPRSEVALTSDERGRFQCDEVPAGERYVGASLPGFAMALARVQTSPAAPATIALVLRTGVTLSGRVTNSEGAPVPDVEVAAHHRRITVGFRTDTDVGRSMRTDADGRYRIAAIMPGEFTARVMVEPMLQRELTGADGEELTWDPVRDAPRTISGVVVDANDEPLSGWQISATESQINPLSSPGRRNTFGPRSVTDAGGRFEVTGLADAPYRVFVFAPWKSGEHSPAANQVPRAIANGVR
ncbi:MAG TPA: sigma-70 family RNA polymerase sigma factor, partial [Planctomycetota bacterium]